MPQAVLHILFTIIVLDLLRDYFLKDRKKLPLHYVFIGGIAGLVPDADIPLYWLVNNVLGIQVEWFHRTITHSLFFPLVFLALTFAAMALSRRKKVWLFFAVVTFGFSVHLLLWNPERIYSAVFSLLDDGVWVQPFGTIGLACVPRRA
ncbi:metal-dependent hydrolase [Candidatus Woesearchaeota archaeon]|nr:metal-dependent hydrolase [Candidatus Woesearchaeota archaeon]